jgi:hypothetical protein
LTFWFLAFAAFVFFSLAVLKRYIELNSSASTISNRGYEESDIKLVPAFGIASSYISVLILVLYLNHHYPSANLEHPIMILILLLLMLFWYTRLWLLALRKKLHDDPVVFVVKDPYALIIALVFFVILNIIK